MSTPADSTADKLAARKDARVSLALSFVIGALVGLIVIAFILLTGRLAARMYPPGSAAWRRVLTPIIGALVSGYLLFRFFPDARGSGIPQTKYALFLNDGLITLKTAMGKFLCCAVSLASGIALGREGPSVQIGAGLASVLGRRFGLSKRGVRDLIPMGCAAALAAAFNTPIAAVLFTLEEVLGDLHAPVLGSIVISSATSWMLLHAILGDQPLFHVPAYRLVNPVEFLIYAVLGVVGGLGSVCFVKLLLQLRLWFRKLPRWSVWMQPALGGITVGLLGLYLPEVLGVGYDYVERVLGGDLAIRTVVLLIGLKIVATSVCYSSGNAGGIFGPSLFIGAMIGGTVGSVAHHFFPAVTAGPGAYALVGMGAAFAGIIRTPLTSVIMIFELTRDYTIIVPVMIANLIAFIISYRLQRQPIYEALAHQDGIFLPTEERGQSGPTVGAVMRPLDGTSVVEAHALANTQVFVHADHSLNVALERMGASKLDALPVVSRIDRNRVVGIITMADLLAAYGVGESRL